MHPSWTAHFKTKEEKELFKEDYVRSMSVLKQLKVILEAKIEELEKKRESTAIYEKAAWSMYQADFNGAIRELKYINNLIETIDND